MVRAWNPVTLIVCSENIFRRTKERTKERTDISHFGSHIGRARSILSRKISGFESVPRAILRMIRLFVRISHLRSVPLCREQYPREERHPGTKDIKAATLKIAYLRFCIKIETALYTRDLFSIPPAIVGRITINRKHMDLISDSNFATYAAT